MKQVDSWSGMRAVDGEVACGMQEDRVVCGDALGSGDYSCRNSYVCCVVVEHSCLFNKRC